jgi:lipopolysaccharide transport system permease protein
LPNESGLGHPLVIEAGKLEKQYFKDLWLYRELFYILAWRDVVVRYKQTVIGLLWAIIRPLATMVVFSIIFGKIAKMPSDGIPYPLFVFAAMLPWQFFSSAMSESSVSLIGNSNMISKVYFPRLIMPASAVIVSFTDFLISFMILIPIMAWYQFVPSIRILTLPLFILLAFMAALGIGLWLCALTVKYRDFRFVVPFVAQFGLYVSPVGFGSNVIPEKYRLIYSLNPMVSVIDGFRWAMFGNTQIYMPGFLISLGMITLLFITGLRYFRKTERTFADII